MSCEKHPDKEDVANCAVCGKAVCEECLIEIAGNSYCKDCVNELVTESILKDKIGNKTTEEPVEENEPMQEEAKIETVDEIEPIQEELEKPKFRSASNVSEILEDEGIIEEETPKNTNEISTGEYPKEETEEINTVDEDLEAKYEKYLEDLYYDEPEKNTSEPTITGEYIEEPTIENTTPDTTIGITGEYIEPEEDNVEDDIIVPAHAQKQDDNGLSYEEIRERILTETTPEENDNTAAERYIEEFEQEQRNYQKEIRNQYLHDDEVKIYGDESLYYDDIINKKAINDESNKNDGFTKGEIALSIILIILIIIVMSYVIYLFTLSNDYPSYFDAVRVLFTNPTQLFDNILN